MLCVGIGGCKYGFNIHYQCVCPVTKMLLLICWPLLPFFFFCFVSFTHNHCFLSLLFLSLSLFLPHTLIFHLTYLLRLLLCPIPVNLLFWLGVTLPLALSLPSSYWMLCFHCGIIHHTQVCVGENVCLLCWGDASLCVTSPAGHYNFHREHVLP